MNVFDSHCHIKAEDPNSGSGAHEYKVAGALFCGTHPLVDWDLIDSIKERENFLVRVGYGIHPWFIPRLLSESVAEASPSTTTTKDGCECVEKFAASSSHELDSCTVEELLSKLEARLEANPRAWVAEIGLDKLRNCEGSLFSLQRHLFVEQLKLAAKWKRPVSVHCVRAFGPMLDILKALPLEYFPPIVALHSFTGSYDFANSLLKLPKKKSQRVYFGFGPHTSTLASFESLTKEIPRDRILYESDVHWSLKGEPLIPEGFPGWIAMLPEAALFTNMSVLLETVENQR